MVQGGRRSLERRVPRDVSSRPRTGSASASPTAIRSSSRTSTESFKGRARSRGSSREPPGPLPRGQWPPPRGPARSPRARPRLRRRHCRPGLDRLLGNVPCRLRPGLGRRRALGVVVEAAGLGEPLPPVLLAAINCFDRESGEGDRGGVSCGRRWSRRSRRSSSRRASFLCRSPPWFWGVFERAREIPAAELDAAEEEEAERVAGEARAPRASRESALPVARELALDGPQAADDDGVADDGEDLLGEGRDRGVGARRALEPVEDLGQPREGTGPVSLGGAVSFSRRASARQVFATFGRCSLEGGRGWRSMELRDRGFGRERPLVELGDQGSEG